MLSAVNSLSEKGAVNSRLHLAQFGRDIAMKLLELWKGSKGDLLKLEVVKFFRLQLTINDQRTEISASDWQVSLSLLSRVVADVN